MQTTSSIQGDMWDTISRRVYGAEAYSAQLIAANPQHRFVSVFPAGIALKVPPLATTALEARGLPPWMRGR